MAGGDAGAATTLQNSQCVSGERGNGDGGTERQHVNADATDDIQARLRGGQETSTCTTRMYQGPTVAGNRKAPGPCPAGSGVPAPVSVTPNSGSGATQSFALQYSDTAGAGEPGVGVCLVQHQLNQC